MPDDTPTLAAEYFDGRSPLPQAVRLRAAGGRLHIEGATVRREVALAGLAWPERTRHGARVLHLEAGDSLHCADAAAWDAWARGLHREGLAVRLQQSWRLTLAALALLVVLAAAGYRWGVPAAARGVLALVPASVDAEVGAHALGALRERGWLGESQRTPAQRERVRAAWQEALARSGTGVPHRLHFHHGKALGANAFALPGGDIVVTDGLLALAEDRDDIVIGVLAHELAHVRHRHGMRGVVQASLLAVASSAALGDFSGVVAVLPALLGQLAYSRDFEREADRDARALLREAGLAPSAMAVLFERLAAQRRMRGAPAEEGDALGIAFSSHPADAERIAFFRDGAP